MKKLLYYSKRYFYKSKKLALRELRCFLNIKNYIGLLTKLYSNKKQDTILCEIKKMKILLSKKWGDLQILKEVFCEDYYFNKFIDLKKISTMADLGGHKGYVSLLYAGLIPNIKIVSLEPEEENYLIFEENIKNNRLEDKITLLKNAIWSQDCIKTFYKIKTYSAGHTFYETHLEQYEKIKHEVKCLSLATVMKECGFKKIDLLKIDVEGAEYEVLFNLEKTILRNIRYILIECHRIDNNSDQDIKEFLEKNNFETHYIYDYEAFIVAVNTKG